MEQKKSLVLLLIIFGLMVVVSIGFLAIRNIKKTGQGRVIEVRPTEALLPSLKPEPTHQSQLFPDNSYFVSEGEVWISEKETNSTLAQRYFTLHINIKDSDQDISFPIKLTGSVDWVDNPKISYGANYGCVTIQTSGYRGYYVFDIQTGDKISQGPQYSDCVQWIDPQRVMIFEQPWNTQEVKYYLLNAQTEQKEVLSSFDAAKIKFDAYSLKKTYQDENIFFQYPAAWEFKNAPDGAGRPSLTFWECGSRVFGLDYLPVKGKGDMLLGVKSDYGPGDQISKIISVAGVKAGLLIKPVGDGSGGYEPSYILDFLAKSQATHIYLSSYSGCSQSIDITYEKYVLPLSKTVTLLK